VFLEFLVRIRLDDFQEKVGYASANAPTKALCWSGHWQDAPVGGLKVSDHKFKIGQLVNYHGRECASG
jgi:hypothetical protein